MKNRVNLFSILLFTLAAIGMGSCKSAQTLATDKVEEAKDAIKVSYATDIAPIIEAKCTPCHFPAQNGSKDPLDSYETMKDHGKAALYRVTLSEEDPKFMPFKLKKPALTEDEITKLKAWIATGFPE